MTIYKSIASAFKVSFMVVPSERGIWVYFAIKYQRLAKRRGKEKALIAIAWMMLTSIYHMLSENKDFHPDNYEATVNPPKQKPIVLTLNNTLQFLREQRADPETLILIH